MAQEDRDPSHQARLDPQDWEAFRDTARAMLDTAIDHMQQAEQGRVWTPFPEATKSALIVEVPSQPTDVDQVRERLEQLLPYGVGNTHPRFFGWVHGSGAPGNMIAEIAASAMNANLGGRDHGAIYVERQVVEWCRQMMRFPKGTSGLVVTGTSMATVVALKVARDRALGWQSRRQGVGAARLVGYTSEQTHSCVARAFDILGLGSDALRKIPTGADFRLDVAALEARLEADKAAGLTPFAVIGTAGSVNVGAIDDLAAIAEICDREGLWFHVDGAFGALAMLSDSLRPRLSGLEQADSVAFDFHKWMHVNYDAGCVLVRNETEHLKAFSDRPEYLETKQRGLASGFPWPVDFGPELSRGFRALKVWAHIIEHGTEKLGRVVERNCDQAAYLGRLVRANGSTELMAPVALNICCFRVVRNGMSQEELDALNDEIVMQLQEEGTAAPSTTIIGGRTVIRVNITNHRTRHDDMDILFGRILELNETDLSV